MKVNNCIGLEVQSAINALEPGQILFLENVRFHPGEVVNDTHFAAQLAANAELMVNDAFSLAHRWWSCIPGCFREGIAAGSKGVAKQRRTGDYRRRTITGL